MKKLILILVFAVTFLNAGLFAEDVKKIALCITATGKYDEYANRLIDSAEKYFLIDHNVTYFVFSDGKINKKDNVVHIDQKRLGWPLDTLKRFHVYQKNKELFKDYEYIFALDADMLFVDDVGSEILSKRVATRHPGFLDKRGSYETNKKSKACVNKKEGNYYFAGGFYGGESNEFFKLLSNVIKNIDDDLMKDFIAVWHDESHLNRYFIDNKPTLMLSPSYCYPESWKLKFKKKILALDKNHSEMRK